MNRILAFSGVKKHLAQKILYKMKRYFYIPFLFWLSPNISFAQCVNDKHSTNPNDSWLSCQVLASPNPTRTGAHWLMYDLGYIYKIGTTKFWNYNVAGETGKGFKDTFIDYSIDGQSWVEVADFQIPEASGSPDYTGVSGPDLGGIEARYILITSQNTWDAGTCAGLSEARFDVLMGVKISAKVFLEGNYDGIGNMMSDDLRSQNLIPDLEPYSKLGYAHKNGGGYEYLNIPALNTTGNDAIVDWLAMELRYKSDADSLIATQTVLLQRDGDIVAGDGISVVHFPSILADDYYIVLRHRNHIGIRSTNIYALSNTSTEIDFTNNISIIHGGINGIKDLGNGIYAMFSGDTDLNNQIQNSNQSSATSNIGKAGYLQGDIDLNGQVQNTDVQLKLIPNIGKGAQY